MQLSLLLQNHNLLNWILAYFQAFQWPELHTEWAAFQMLLHYNKLRCSLGRILFNNFVPEHSTGSLKLVPNICPCSNSSLLARLPIHWQLPFSFIPVPLLLYQWHQSHPPDTTYIKICRVVSNTALYSSLQQHAALFKCLAAYEITQSRVGWWGNELRYYQPQADLTKSLAKEF